MISPREGMAISTPYKGPATKAVAAASQCLESYYRFKRFMNSPDNVVFR
jgi:hypothetical protein